MVLALENNRTRQRIRKITKEGKELNIKNKLKFIKKLLLELLKDRIDSEELKNLIADVETIEELNEILLNKNLTPLEKDIEFVKMVVKKNVKDNRSIGMKSKLALISIINKNLLVRDIVLDIIRYVRENDLNM